jgi:hypothetical protein
MLPAPQPDAGDPDEGMSRRPTYVLISSESTGADSMDLYGAIAAWWRHRLAFAIALIGCLALGLTWASMGQTRVEYSIVLRPALSGKGELANQPLSSVSSMIARCEQIVFPSMLAEVDPATDRTRFEGIDPTASGSDALLVLRASAPLQLSESARAFLEEASSRVVASQAIELSRYREILNDRIEDLDRRIAVVRDALLSPSTPPGSIESTQLNVELTRLEVERDAAATRLTMSEEAKEARSVLESSSVNESTWRLKRVATAIAGAVVVAAAAPMLSILVAGVRRRLKEPAVA